MTASVGDTVHFRCLITEGHPVADMVWYKSNTVIATGGNGKTNYTVGFLLTFERVKKSDEGTYFCAAVNKAGFARKFGVLHVSGKLTSP